MGEVGIVDLWYMNNLSNWHLATYNNNNYSTGLEINFFSHLPSGQVPIFYSLPQQICSCPHRKCSWPKLEDKSASHAICNRVGVRALDNNWFAEIDY